MRPLLLSVMIVALVIVVVAFVRADLGTVPLALIVLVLGGAAALVARRGRRRTRDTTREPTGPPGALRKQGQ